MRKIFTTLIASAAMLAILANPSQAGLVEVRMDVAGVSMPGSNNITNSVGNATGSAVAIADATGWQIFGNGTADATYSIGGMSNFSSFFNSGRAGIGFPFDSGAFATVNPNAAATFDGFRLVLNSGLASNMGSVSVTSGSSTVTHNFSGMGNFTFDFRNFSMETPNSVTFNITNSIGSVTMVGVSAIPEPSAMMLVGSVIGLGLARRRR